jgi:Zn-finger nucleic acid-binding protein
MNCPLCEGVFEPIAIRKADGSSRQAKRCSQCSGFWFDVQGDEGLAPDSVADLDIPQPNYSLRHMTLTCPVDETLLEQSEHEAGPTGLKIWTCPDCRGVFYPRGQLALFYQWAAAQGMPTLVGPRSQAALAVMLTVLGGILTFASANSQGFQAAVAEPLPTGGPNILTLVLIALAYISGTVLAVLGRRLPIILMGWSVITICLFGFFVIIFGP